MRLVDDEPAQDGNIGGLQGSLDGHVHPGDGTGVLDGDQYPVACAGKDRLEAGSVGLEESIGLYKQGLRLHAACETRLREAELTITELGRRGVTGAEPDEA